MKVRPATIEDAPLLAQLNAPTQDIFTPASYDTSLVQTYIQLLGEADTYIFIGEVDGLPVGYIHAVVHRRGASFAYAMKSILVDQISLRPDAQLHDYARHLLQAVYDLAHSLDIQKVVLDTWLFNTIARSFFKKQSASGY